jgi:hypothetical protein
LDLAAAVLRPALLREKNPALVLKMPVLSQQKRPALS